MIRGEGATYQRGIDPDEGGVYLACDPKSYEPVMLVWWNSDAFWPYVYDENTRSFHAGNERLMKDTLGDEPFPSLIFKVISDAEAVSFARSVVNSELKWPDRAIEEHRNDESTVPAGSILQGWSQR